MSEITNPFPAPRSCVIDGVPVTMMWPQPPPTPTDAPPTRQPARADDLPLEPDELERATRIAGRLAALVGEVLSGRRPAAQLQAVLDDESSSMLAAWARLGVLRPQRAGVPRLCAIDTNTVEGWIPYLVSGRGMVATLRLSRLDAPWHATHLRLLAPEGAKRGARMVA